MTDDYTLDLVLDKVETKIDFENDTKLLIEILKLRY